jgi:low affinity Fe/Cu permease
LTSDLGAPRSHGAVSTNISVTVSVLISEMLVQNIPEYRETKCDKQIDYERHEDLRTKLL